MNYVIGDIHNDNEKLSSLLKSIAIKPEDHVYFLGDLFDRCNLHPDPVGVYFNVLRLGNQATVLMGNHDRWLADYIDELYSIPERKKKKIRPYHYNTFDLLRTRLTDIDIMDMARFIRNCPYQVQLEVLGNKYLLAHARTSLPKDKYDCSYYLMGMDAMIGIAADSYYMDGIDGYISVCGHTETSLIGSFYSGTYSEDGIPSIWKNARKNVILMDCGCGYPDGRLACLCLETGEEFYC